MVIVLGSQVWGIARGRIATDRYFCWAPFDTYTEYIVSVQGSNGWWSADEITSRYRISTSGRDNRSPEHIIDVLRQYERTYGLADPVLRVQVRYQVNGGAENTWEWPEMP